VSRLAFLALTLGLAAWPASAPAIRPCGSVGETLASSEGSRIYRVGDEIYGCWRESDEPRLLDRIDPAAPAEPSKARIAGRFGAYQLGSTTRLADLATGNAVGFDAVAESLRVSRIARVAWIAGGVDGFEVHRADLAERDKLLDSGPDIARLSLTVRRGKLRWRNGGKTRSADFEGMRDDKSPIDDRHLRLIDGTSEVNGPGPTLWRYGVEVEDGLPIDRVAFAAAVDRILFDRRGWLGRGSRISLLRVDEPPFDFMVTLAKPRTVDRLCLPLHTASRVSCENRGRSVINFLRWSTGSPYWSDKTAYRRYLINHEVGHSLGHKHRFCGGRGQVAPVMQQQTGPATPCRHASWPKRFERARSGAP
jgi:hypothetical protein